MKHYIIILACLVAICSAAQYNAQDTASMPGNTTGEVKASAFVDKKEVPLNRPLLFTVKIEWFGNLDRFEIEEFENPVVSNFEIMGTASSNQVGETAGQTLAVKEYEFTLRPTSLGMGYIEGVIIKYRDTSSGESRRLITNRLEAKIIDPVPEPGERHIPWLIILPIFVVVCSGTFLFWFIRQKKEEQRRLAELANVVPPEEVFLNELKTAFDISSPQADLKENYAGLSRLYRQYLAEKYEISALETTTNEVLSLLKNKDLDDRLLNETDEILKKCDVAKFGGGITDKSELQRVYTLIEDILQRNLHITAEPKTEK